MDAHVDDDTKPAPYLSCGNMLPRPTCDLVRLMPLHDPAYKGFGILRYCLEGFFGKEQA